MDVSRDIRHTTDERPDESDFNEGRFFAWRMRACYHLVRWALGPQFEAETALIRRMIEHLIVDTHQSVPVACRQIAAEMAEIPNDEEEIVPAMIRQFAVDLGLIQSRDPGGEIIVLATGYSLMIPRENEPDDFPAGPRLLRKPASEN